MRATQQLIDKVQYEAALMVAQGKPLKSIYEKLGISQRTLWNWRQEPAFKDTVRQYQEAAREVTFGALVELGDAAVRKLMEFLAVADPMNVDTHRVALNIVKMLKDMGYGTQTASVVETAKAKGISDELLNQVFGIEVSSTKKEPAQ